jgi:hypothetical protein
MYGKIIPTEEAWIAMVAYWLAQRILVRKEGIEKFNDKRGNGGREDEKKDA